MTLGDFRNQTATLPANTELTVLNNSMSAQDVVIVAATEDGVVLDIEAEND